MSRRSDPSRIDAARREAAVARLISAGHDADRARALVAEWLWELARPPARGDWEAFDQWLSARRARGPPLRARGYEAGRQEV